jgi:hypothetical protein
MMFAEVRNTILCGMGGSPSPTGKDWCGTLAALFFPWQFGYVRAWNYGNFIYNVYPRVARV